jgi:hypothetical protein
LQKNPEERYQSAQDIKLELQWIAADRSAPAVTTAEPATKPSSNKERLGWAAALLAAIVLTAAAVMLFYHPPQSAHSIRAVIDAPEKTTFNLTGDSAGPPILSPDGSSIAFAATGADGRTGLWVRPTKGLEARALPGTEGAIFPFWSPDSRSLGFFAESKLKTIELDGGSAQIICDVPLGRGGAWGPSGVILFSPAPSAPLMRVSASGGTPVSITKLDNTLHTSHRWPFFLADGKHFLYIALHHDASKSANNMLYYASLDGRENRPLFRSQTNAVYASGFLLFGRGDQLMAQPFNPSSGTLSGEAQNVAKGVMNDASTWHMDASASNDGLLVFGSGASGDLELVWMDRSGKQISTIAGNLPDLQAQFFPRKETASLSSLTPVRPTSGCSTWHAESAPDSPSDRSGMFSPSGRPTANGSPTPPLAAVSLRSAENPPMAAARKRLCLQKSISPHSTAGRATAST